MAKAKYLDCFGRSMVGILNTSRATKNLNANQMAEIHYNFDYHKFSVRIVEIKDIKRKWYGAKGDEIYFYTVRPMSMDELASTVKSVACRCGWG